ncbi:aldo-keto reductase family protein [Flindersiella endophytica]
MDSVGLRRLGTTPIEVTPLGLGCMQFAGTGLVEGFFPPIERQAAVNVVRTALDGGVNWFDTAEMYGRGNSERMLTTALRELGVAPGTVAIATKWSPGLRTSASIGRTIQARLDALQGYPIDLHQIHMPYGGLSSIRSQVVAMAKLAKAGKVSAVGVSNFSAKQMELAAEVLRRHGLTLASNQVQISLLERHIENNGVLDTARRLGVTLIAYSPLRSGVLTGRFHDDPEQLNALPRMRRLLGGLNVKRLERTRPLIDELRTIGDAYGVTAGQVALSWVITYYGESVVAIPGASKPRQAEESAAAMRLRLTEKELDRLSEVSAVVSAR